MGCTSILLYPYIHTVIILFWHLFFCWNDMYLNWFSWQNYSFSELASYPYNISTYIIIVLSSSHSYIDFRWTNLGFAQKSSREKEKRLQSMTPTSSFVAPYHSGYKWLYLCSTLWPQTQALRLSPPIVNVITWSWWADACTIHACALYVAKLTWTCVPLSKQR